MVTVTSADILRINVEAIVNPVNCVGVMGKGLALQFKYAYPDNFDSYQRACRRGDIKPGMVFTHMTGMRVNPRYIINFPTKRHWKDNSRIEDIESGLVALVDTVNDFAIKSIAIPALGCGLGGLQWNDVRLRIERAFTGMGRVNVILIEPLP